MMRCMLGNGAPQALGTRPRCKGPEAEESYYMGGITIKAMRQSEQEGDGELGLRAGFAGPAGPCPSQKGFGVSVHRLGTTFGDLGRSYLMRRCFAAVRMGEE